MLKRLISERKAKETVKIKKIARTQKDRKGLIERESRQMRTVYYREGKRREREREKLLSV